MSPGVLSLVLLAALLHAAWNALVKSGGGDALSRVVLISVGAGLCAVALLPFVELPPAASWPYLAGSVLVHQVYFACLVMSYRHGDLSFVYPVARGAAPLLVAGGAALFAGETLNAAGLCAVALICGAILMLAGDGRRQGGGGAALGFALGTGLSIACYTLLDGLGGRAAGRASDYIVYLFALEWLPVTLYALLWRGAALRQGLRRHWRAGLGGGVMSFAAYALVIWAMSRAPMSYVSALRETSVIAAAWIGARLLAEPVGARRVLAAVLVAGGVVLLQLTG